jgi:hypothetical protein
MTPAELIARARSATGKGIKYKLGAGGMNPSAELPCNADRDCDCSGMSNWAVRLSRFTRHPLYDRGEGGWINTDTMVADGNRLAGFFELLVAPRIGALIVYPRSKVSRIGHVGIVSVVKGDKAAKVIHCSAGNYRKGGDAIAETPAEVFYRPNLGTVYLWFCGMEGGYDQAQKD